MSSTLSPRNQSSSRTWWPRSTKSSSSHNSKDVAKTFPEKPTATKSHSSLKFNAFASAMGLKSKKHAAPAVQESVTRMRSLAQPTVYNRPPSKSVSSTRSRGDSIGPHTPTDGQRDPPNNRHSLLTLSDTDPFAPSSVLTPTSYVSSDPNRLSAYSSNSDYGSKKNDMTTAKRGSYASSSSASNNFGGITGENFPPPPTPPVSDAPHIRKLTTQKSTGSLNRRISKMNGIPTMATALETFPQSLASLPKSESSITITEKPRLRTMSNLQHPVSVAPRRPTTRSRGLTEGSISYRNSHNDGVKYSPSDTNLSSRMQPSYPPTPPTPRVIIRQASSSRLRHPPSAPPAHELPPPPTAYLPVDEARDAPGLPLASSSSSILSFATSSAREGIQVRTGKLGNIPKEPRGRPPLPAEVGRDWDHTPRQSTGVAYPNGSRMLKKSVSYQALAQPTSPPQTTLPPPPQPRAVDKSRSKERHLHPPRLAFPPRYATSFTSQSHLDDDPTMLEQQRDTASSSTYTRKRLFSGSSIRQPSMSRTILSENDAHSLLSPPSEPDSSHPQMSFWEEALLLERPSAPSPHPDSVDYTPQQIMSPAQMASFERSVEERSTYPRRRGYSIMSASTVASEREREIPSPLSLSPTMKLSTLPMRFSTISSNTCFSSATALSIPSSSAAAAAALGSPPLIPDSPRPVSPATPTPGAINSAGAAHDNDIENVHLMKRNDIQAASMNSLPPPPRRRRPATTGSVINPVFRETDTLPSFAQPPRRTSSTFGTHVPLAANRVRSRVVSAAGRGHRLSIFRKPSFLEIDDDDNPAGSAGSGLGARHVIALRNSQLPVRASARVQDSFLDLARESFDSMRS